MVARCPGCDLPYEGQGCATCHRVRILPAITFEAWARERHGWVERDSDVAEALGLALTSNKTAKVQGKMRAAMARLAERERLLDLYRVAYEAGEIEEVVQRIPLHDCEADRAYVRVQRHRRKILSILRGVDSTAE